MWLKDSPGEEEASHRGLYHKPIIKHFSLDYKFSLKETDQSHAFDFCCVRVDDPNISFLEDAQQILVLDELKHNNDVSKRLVQPDPLHDFPLIRKDANVL